MAARDGGWIERRTGGRRSRRGAFDALSLGERGRSRRSGDRTACGNAAGRPNCAPVIERLRLDFPSWGRDKLGPLLRKAGFTVSNATAGRILRSRTERADVIPT
jgi:hypothetical protein